MAEAAAPQADTDDWVIDRLFGEDAVPGSAQPHSVDSASVASSPDVVMSSAEPAEERRSDNVVPDDIADSARHPAMYLGAAVLAAALLIVGAFAWSDRPLHSMKSAPVPERPTTAVTAAPRTNVAPISSDQAIPFTAAAPGCKGGSTPAQSLSDSTGDSPWVCVRGTPDEQADGQLIHIEFRCDAARPASVCSYLVSSVSVTPGSVTATPGGNDDWLAHRVVSRLQYNFYNGNELADILTQDTGNVHGPATTSLRHPVLASHVVVIVLQTARPPVSPLPEPTSVAAQAQSGPPDPGAATDTPMPTSPSAVSDPVDATFAVSGMQFFGHQPS